MKSILLTVTLTLVFGGLSTFAATDTPRTETGNYRFSRLEATETSWDYTSIIYSVTDLAGHELSVPPSQITYVVRDKSSNRISYGKGVFVTINDTRLASEEDYSITIHAMVRKEQLSQTIYRRASAKKLILQQQGNAFAYKMMRPKYSNPAEYEKLNIDASDMSVEVAFAGCRSCSAFRLTGSSSHATLTDALSYRDFEVTVNSLIKEGKKVQLMVQPTISHKDNAIRYAQSYFEVTPDALKEVHVEEATASEKEVEGEE